MKKKKVTIKSGGAGTVIKDALESPIAKPIVKVLKKLIWKDGEDCGCEEREKKINDLLPARFTARCLTENEHKEWSVFQNERSLRLSGDQVLFVCKLYADVFRRLYWKPCMNCSPKPLIGMIEKLDLVHKTYEK